MKRIMPLFLVLGTIEIAAEGMGNDVLKYAVKPTVVMMLVIGFAGTLGFAERYKKAALFGMVWGIVGDVLLMMPERKLFIPGLVAFLIGHLGYIATYALEPKPGQLDKKRSRIATAVVIAMAAAATIIIWPTLGKLQIPVTAYILVISSMAIVAAWRRPATDAGWSLVFAGAVVFIISDASIAVNRFYTPIPGARYLIMTTYFAAQALIANGLAQSFEAAESEG